MLTIKSAIVILFLLVYTNSYSQFFPRFSIAGGPTIGWQWNNTDDINAQMQKLGVPGFPTDGFLILGGGGFIDLPFKSVNWLRVGGMGTGFTSERQTVTSNNITKTVYYSIGAGGISFEYVKSFSKKFEVTGGVLLSTGKISIDVYQNTADYGNWNTIFNELDSSLASQNITRNFSARYYSVQPIIGIGYFVAPFIYAKLNAGYIFSANNQWTVDNDTPVSNVPSGISANGFNINFGLNFGLFTK